MSKSKSIIVTLFFLTCLCFIGFIISVMPVYALETLDTSDNRFRFTAPQFCYVGAPLTDFSEVDPNDGYLCLPLSADNSLLNGYVSNISIKAGKRHQYECFDTQARLNLSVYMKDNDNDVKICAYDIVSAGKYTSVYFKEFSPINPVRLDLTSYLNETLISCDFDLVGSDLMFQQMKNQQWGYPNWIGTSSCIGTYKSDTNFGYPFVYENNGAFMYINFQNASPNETYYIVLQYKVLMGCYYDFWHSVQIDGSKYEGKIISGDCCMADVCQTLLDSPDSDSQIFANAILYNFVNETIDVELLENIEDTPFVKKNRYTITVPLLNRKPVSADVCAALGVDNLFLREKSLLSGFEYDSGKNVYIAQYYPTATLVAKTATGNTANYVLHIDQSYYEYFHQFVNDDIISEDVYGYFFQYIKNKYTVLQNMDIQPDELYGIWGFVPIPQTASISAVWKDLFDIDTAIHGSLDFFCLHYNLTGVAYNKLLYDYGYSWVSRALNVVTNDVLWSMGADYYFFYVDDYSDDVLYVADNGSTEVNDDRGAFGISVSNGISAIGDLFGSWFGNVKAFAGIIGLVLIIIVGVIVFIKIADIFSRRKR